MRERFRVGVLGLALAVWGAAPALAQAPGDAKGTIKSRPARSPGAGPNAVQIPHRGRRQVCRGVGRLLPRRPTPSEREKAIKMLTSFGPAGRKAGSKLLIKAMSEDGDISVRLVALATVPNLGFEPEDVKAGLAVMVKMLHNQQFHTRHEAAMALGNCGPVARSAVATLAELTIKDPSSWQVRKAAAYALGRCGYPQNEKDVPDPAAVSALANAMLNDKANEVRMEAIRSFMIIGPPGTEERLGRPPKRDPLRDQALRAEIPLDRHLGANRPVTPGKATRPRERPDPVGVHEVHPEQGRRVTGRSLFGAAHPRPAGGRDAGAEGHVGPAHGRGNRRHQRGDLGAGSHGREEPSRSWTSSKSRRKRRPRRNTASITPPPSRR